MVSYPKAALTSDAVVLTGQGQNMKVLLIRRKNPPYQSCYAFPGGFSEPEEAVSTSCVRELEEETGLVLPAGTGFGLSLRSIEGRDPRGWTISQPFVFWLENEMAVEAKDDANWAGWVPLSELKELAFDHGAILCEALGSFWSFMPKNWQEKATTIQAWGEPKMGSLESIIFFGGSFNPWHQGHLECIRQVEKNGLVVVVPDNNPQKKHKQNGCSWQSYKTLVNQLQAKNICVYPGYIGMEGQNPTASWLSYVKTTKRSMVIGADSFVGLSKWIDAEQLVTSLDVLYIVPRNENEQKIEEYKKWLNRVAPKIELQFLKSHEFEHISSSNIRKKADS